MWIEAAGIKIYYEQQGKGSQQILLLHGWGCSTALWKPVASFLSEGACVTAIDFPGHGQSERPPCPWGATEFAEVVASVIEQLSLQGCAIIGHSHGGRIALRLAIDRPELVGKLVLTGSAGLRAKPNIGQKMRTTAFQILRVCCDGMEKSHLFGRLPTKVRNRVRRRFGSTDYNALDDEMRKTFVKLIQTDLTEELHQVRASTLLIWGDHDTETPLWMGQCM
ncbi:MAG: alpha/beta hydrolase, partial [Clostridia bacterium]